MVKHGEATRLSPTAAKKTCILCIRFGVFRERNCP